MNGVQDMEEVNKSEDLLDFSDEPPSQQTLKTSLGKKWPSVLKSTINKKWAEGPIPEPSRL